MLSWHEFNRLIDLRALAQVDAQGICPGRGRGQETRRLPQEVYDASL